MTTSKKEKISLSKKDLSWKANVFKNIVGLIHIVLKRNCKIVAYTITEELGFYKSVNWSPGAA